MENEKEIKEPYTPENTPNPPQIIDPNRRPEDPSEGEPVKAEKKSKPDQHPDRKNTKPGEAEKKEKVPGAPEIKISDETTI